MLDDRVQTRLCSQTLLAIVALVAAAGPAWPATFYVRNGGSDAASGLSLPAAWATPAHAAEVVNPGDVVRVQDGSYAGFYLERSGTAGSPITFVADGSNVQITADNGVTPDGINIENAAHIVIDGFLVDNRSRAGIRIALSQFVTIRNCRTGYNQRWGIFSGFADDLTIENNETHHSAIEHGIYVSNSGDRPVIRGNLVHDNRANGIHMNGDESQGGDGIISGAVVERNVIFGNGSAGGSAINMDGVRDSIVRNNLIYGNHASGISLYRIDGATGSRNNLVVNNTILNPSDARWCININGGSTGNILRNNILYNAHSFRGVITIDPTSLAGFVSDSNSVMSRFSLDGGDTVVPLASWQAQGFDLHSLSATPADHFVGSSDFHLRDTSPAIDAGTATGAPADDLDGAPRPIGAGWDLGAYERQLLTCGNGTAESGEQCGEPGLECNDPCTACSGCTCVAREEVCGDSLLCGSEACESDAECAGGQVCSDCVCIHPPPCTSGIPIERASLHLEGSELVLKLTGRAILPRPWSGFDPIANGIRVIVDAISGSGGIDLTIPAGAQADHVGWSVSSRGTSWKYRDSANLQGPVTRVTLRDMSGRQDGLIAWTIRARGGAVTLPPASSVRTSVILGNSEECAALVWNPPGGARPACSGDAAEIRCR